VGRIPLTSSVVAAVAYDDTSRSLDVEYVGGALYRYREVPRDEVDGLLGAESPGRYLNTRIIPHYACVWLRG
jgi:lysyl-tRNA synthetase class 2